MPVSSLNFWAMAMVLSSFSAEYTTSLPPVPPSPPSSVEADSVSLPPQPARRDRHMSAASAILKNFFIGDISFSLSDNSVWGVE